MFLSVSNADRQRCMARITKMSMTHFSSFFIYKEVNMMNSVCRISSDFYIWLTFGMIMFKEKLF